MIDAVERIFNLALHFIHASRPVTAEEIRSEVAGYPSDQDDLAFARMFERDKDDLRLAGLAILFDEEYQSYSLDRTATFAVHVDLSDEEAASIRVAGSALLEDPSFPFETDLRLALAKMAAETDTERWPSASRLADENPESQGTVVSTLSRAAETRKRVSFDYTNSSGRSAPHGIEPFGLFLHDGRWYLVGRDTSLDEIRTYTVDRMTSIVAHSRAPKTPDFERPADFDVASFVRQSFQYGPAETEFETEMRFSPASAWRAVPLAAGHGTLRQDGDEVVWVVPARSRTELIRFIVENGPGIRLVRPADLARDLSTRLREVEALHG